MTTPSQTEGSLKGLGAGLMLPARGNPFEKAPSPPGVELLAVGAERAAPDQTAPAMVSLAPASNVVETPASSVPPEAPMPEPRDLSPEDLMALFPSSHAEREVAAADSPAGSPALPPAAEPLPDSPLAAAPPTVPSLAATAPVPVEPVPAPAAPEPATVPDAQPAAESAPADSSPPAVSPAASQLQQPAGAAPVEPPLVAVPASPTASQRGVRLVGIAAQGGGAEMTLNLTDDGLVTTPFDPGALLPASPALARMFVPDGRLMTLWLEIDAVEADVTSTLGMSQCVASEMLDRLMRARNLLMNDRAQFEEAARQVAEVKYHLTNFRSATFVQKPVFISLYLAVFFVLVMAGVVFGRSLAWDQLQIFNTKLDMLWYTMLVGGIGGFTGAVYSLVQHVARDRDFDPQFALWYYQNPWMGLVLGIFVYIAVYILMNLGTLVMNGQVTGGTLISVLITLFFAWMVGFKHNIAFDLADMAMKKLLPPDNPPAGTDVDSTKSPAAKK